MISSHLFVVLLVAQLIECALEFKEGVFWIRNLTPKYLSICPVPSRICPQNDQREQTAWKFTMVISNKY
jgi:hypothetical protein